MKEIYITLARRLGALAHQGGMGRWPDNMFCCLSLPGKTDSLFQLAPDTLWDELVIQLSSALGAGGNHFHA